MSVAARLLLALAVVAGATLFLVALGADGETAPPETPVETAPSEPAAAPAPPAREGVLDSHETCRECHTEIYEEWEQDRHSQAWVGELYTELSKNHSDPNCFSCHAPRPIFETGLDSPAEARANFREAGITCLTCHQRGHNVLGPRKEPAATPEFAADCGPAYDPAFPAVARPEATSQFCGVCHNLHGTCDEFAGSRYAREGKSCLSCHMEEVVGPVANGGTPRVRRVHRMPGAHDPDMLKRAMTLSARREEGRIVARVTNEGAGHRIPTDARHRGIYLRAAFFDEYGNPVTVTNDQGVPEREITMDLIRLFYRHEQKDPTQIDPDGTLGKDNWRESSVAIPEAARGGYAQLRLYYLLRWDWPMRKGVLVAETKVPLD